MKKIFFILLLLSGVAVSQPAIGTTVGATVVPADSNDIYAVTDARWARDGWRSVADTAARNDITTERRREGMVTVDQSSGIAYQLYGGIDNSNWRHLVPDWVRYNYDPTGFVNRIATLSFTPGVSGATRQFNISGSHTVYNRGQPKLIGNDSVVITDASGLYIIYYDSTYTIRASTDWPGFDVALMATVYWNTTTDQGLLADERHGISMDWETHEYLHNTRGVQYLSGLSITADNTTFSIDTGTIADEDIDFGIHPTTKNTIIYYDGSSVFKWDTGQTTLYKKNGAAFRYNSGTALADVPANSYFCSWVFATNNVNNQIVTLIGQRTDVLIADARVNNSYQSLSLSNLPFKEMKLLYRILWRADATPYEEIQDYRTSGATGGTAYLPAIHSTLSGLSYDLSGHTGFATGVSGKADSSKISDSTKVNAPHGGTTNYYSVFDGVNTYKNGKLLDTNSTTMNKGALHVYNGASGTKYASTSDFIIEDDGNVAVQLLAPGASSEYIYFGYPGDSISGRIRYYNQLKKMYFYTYGLARFNIDSIGTVNITVCANAGTDVDKFVVWDASGNLDHRTGSEVLSDIEAEPAITGGLVSQFWSGIKTWVTLNVAAVAGLTDSLAAKLPLHGTADSTKANAPHGVTTNYYGLSDGTNKWKNGKITDTANVTLIKDDIDILSSNPSIKIGADESATTRTDATLKTSRVGSAHYTNAEEPVGVWYTYNDASNSYLIMGGGTSGQNAITEFRVYTAADNTTTSGTSRFTIGKNGRVRILTTPPTSNGTIYTRNGDTICVSGYSVANLIDSLATGMKKSNFDDSIPNYINGTQNYYAMFDATGHRLGNGLVHDSTAILTVADSNFTVDGKLTVNSLTGTMVVVTDPSKGLTSSSISNSVLTTIPAKQDTIYRSHAGWQNKVAGMYEWYPGDGTNLNPIMHFIYTMLYRPVLRWIGDRFVIKPTGESSDGKIAICGKTGITAWTQSDSAGLLRFAYTDTFEVMDSSTAIVDTASLLFDKNGLRINNSAQYVISASSSTYPFIIAKKGSSGQFFMGLADVSGNPVTDSGPTIKGIGTTYGADNDGDWEIRAGESNIPRGKFGDIKLYPSTPGAVYVIGNSNLIFDRNGGKVEAGDSILSIFGPMGGSDATISTSQDAPLRIKSGSGSNDGAYFHVDTFAVSDGKSIFTGDSVIIGVPMRVFGDTTFTCRCTVYTGTTIDSDYDVLVKLKNGSAKIYLRGSVGATPTTGDSVTIRFSTNLPDPIDTLSARWTIVGYPTMGSTTYVSAGYKVYDNYIKISEPGGTFTSWDDGYLTFFGIVEYEY